MNRRFNVNYDHAAAIHFFFSNALPKKKNQDAGFKKINRWSGYSVRQNLCVCFYLGSLRNWSERLDFFLIVFTRT